MSNDRAFLLHSGTRYAKLIHDYFGLDLEVIWNTAVEDAPVLLAQIEGLVEA